MSKFVNTYTCVSCTTRMRMKYGLLIPYGYFLKEYKFDNCSHVYLSLNVAKHFSILRM